MLIRHYLLAAVLAGAASASLAADVTIGVLMPSTGRIAGFGQQQQHALKMFEDQLATIDGKGKMKFVVYDTRGEISEAINLARTAASAATSPSGATIPASPTT